MHELLPIQARLCRVFFENGFKVMGPASQMGS
jgi:hypothetical protein